MTHLAVDGPLARRVVVNDTHLIARSDEDGGTVVGILAPGHTRHQNRQWLLTSVADILDDDLSISSAGPPTMRGHRLG